MIVLVFKNTSAPGHTRVDLEILEFWQMYSC